MRAHGAVGERGVGRHAIADTIHDDSLDDHQSVVLANASVATEGATTGPTTLRDRLGGFLMSAGGT